METETAYDFYLKNYYSPDLESIQIDGQTLFLLFKSVNSNAYKLMKKHTIYPTLYMTEWFMCIFARSLPWCTVLRVWDMFFCEGIKVLFRVGKLRVVGKWRVVEEEP